MISILETIAFSLLCALIRSSLTNQQIIYVLFAVLLFSFIFNKIHDDKIHDNKHI